MSALTWSGVDLFFVLSGFLIGGILIDKRNSSNYFRTFFIRRICRIFPLYFLIVLSFFVIAKFAPPGLDWLFSGAYPLWTYATFTQNYFMADGGFGPAWLGITWSLAIEEQFYLLMPLLVFFIRDKWLVPILVTMIISSSVARCLIDGLGSYIYTFCRTDDLMMGVLLAYLIRQDGFLKIAHKFRDVIFAIFCALFLIVGYLTYLVTQPGDVLNHIVLALFFTLLILLAMIYQGSPPVGILRNSFLCWLGLRSYGIYLFHQGISMTVHGFLGNHPPRMSNSSDVLLTVSALIITFILAELSFRYFESPCIRYGHKFTFNKKI